MKRATQIALVAFVAAVVFACGGGGCRDCEAEKPSPRVDCTAHPEQCK